MDERIDSALRAFRNSTANVVPPAGLVEALARSTGAPTVAHAITALGRRAMIAAAVMLALLVGSAVVSVRSLEHEAAEFALSRGPS